MSDETEDFRPFRGEPNELTLTAAALHNCRATNEALRMVARRQEERLAALREVLADMPDRDERGNCWSCGCHENSNGGHFDFCKRPALLGDQRRGDVAEPWDGAWAHLWDEMDEENG